MEISEFFPFWEKLTSQEQQLLEESTAVRTYEKGEIIHDGSRGCTGLLLLTEGQMRAYTVTEEGRELTLFRLFPGDVCMFSGYCAVSSVPFPVTVEAWEPTRVLVIPSAVYRGLMDTSLPVARFTSDMMAARLSEMMWLMDQILSRGMDSRLAALLLEEKSISGSATLHTTHEQLARQLSSAREVVSRMLKYFQTEKLVSLSRGTITLLNEKALELLAEGSKRPHVK